MDFVIITDCTRSTMKMILERERRNRLKWDSCMEMTGRRNYNYVKVYVNVVSIGKYCDGRRISEIGRK